MSMKEWLALVTRYYWFRKSYGRTYYWLEIISRFVFNWIGYLNHSL